MKRVFDALIAAVGLVCSLPFLVPALLLIYLQDRRSPFYIAPRVGLNGKMFKMVKVRTMIVKADATGVDSTKADDPRITMIGALLRRFKLDELTQLWNVLKGDMSLVGPRPNVSRETSLYTPEEQRLLTVQPGVTDFASIVFSDEGEILQGRADPDISYNQLIRPWKSRLGLFYVDHHNLLLDLRLIALTAVAIANRPAALKGIVQLLRQNAAPEDLVRISMREDELTPAPPPGSAQVVTSRSL